MLRTWLVRLPASVLTLSVRSFQTPLTPFTLACPPSLPSVPTSRATRVTSSAKDESWSTMAFTIVPRRRNSPLIGCPSMRSAIFWERSPCATASITRATSDVGRTRSSTMPLTASIDAAHVPCAPGTAARSVRRPSRPTILPTRRSSFVVRSRMSARSLKAVASSPATPRRRVERRTPAAPSRAARSAARSSSSASGSMRPRRLGRRVRAVRCGGRARGRRGGGVLVLVDCHNALLCWGMDGVADVRRASLHPARRAAALDARSLGTSSLYPRGRALTRVGRVHGQVFHVSTGETGPRPGPAPARGRSRGGRRPRGRPTGELS